MALAKDRVVVELLQTFFHEEGFVFEGSVPVVLAVIVCPAYESLGNFCPPTLECSLTEEQNPLFVYRPWNLDYERVQVVVPAFSYLFSTALGCLSRNEVPVLRAITRHQLHKLNIFMTAP